MVKRAAQEEDIAARLHLFDHRVVEELFDVENDPDCLNNLVDDPNMQGKKLQLRKQLAESLGRLKDPITPLLANFEDDELRNEYMAKEDARAAAARRNRGKRKQSP
jgi:N-sulfoglucosamine sulfohydrolase